MTRKEIKSRKRYFAHLFIYVAILLVAGFIGLKVLWSFAKEYETSDVDNVLNSYMTELNETKWNDAIASAADNLRNEFQSKEDVEAVVKDYLSQGDISYKNSGLGEIMKYDLFSNGNNIGEVTFTENLTANTRFKLYPWAKTSEEFNFDFLKSTEDTIVEIPENFSLQINGKDVPEEYITDDYIPYDVLSSLYIQYSNLPYKVRYDIPNLVGDVDITVLDGEGNEFDMDESANDLQFVGSCTDSEKLELRLFMESGFVEAYVNFWGTKWVDSTYPTLMAYVVEGSPLQQEMYTYTLDAVNWIHTNSVVINDMSFNYALSLGGGYYVVSESVDTTAYADYKTVNETSDVVVVVMKDSETGEIKAIDRA